MRPDRRLVWVSFSFETDLLYFHYSVSVCCLYHSVTILIFLHVMRSQVNSEFNINMLPGNTDVIRDVWSFYFHTEEK